MFRVVLAVCFAIASLFRSEAHGHEVGGVNWQYARLSPVLQKQLRMRDIERTAAKVRGYEASTTESADKRKLIISQFKLGGTGETGFEQIYIKKTLWPPRHRLRVCFFDGSPPARKHVIGLFEAIVSETNLKLDTTDRDCPDAKADIQVRFNERDCFSYYGMDAIAVIKENVDFSTMGLCHLEGPTWTESNDGTIRHEIMHSLGAAHEHQHPDSKCKDEFDLDAFRNPPLFDPDPTKNEDAIRVNIEEITKSYTQEELAIIKYDPKSIMHYRLPTNYFKNGQASTCALAKENNHLSEADWSFLRTMYPK